MGINVHLMCKYICNRLGLVVKGPHVKCEQLYIRDHVCIIVACEL
jgi:hypothetical protein